jgi:glycosyltransferase involved in cell wall biosynthesis
MTPRLNHEARYGIIIPACNEQACLRAVLRELRDVIDERRFQIVVGINGTDDMTAQVAREAGVLVAETRQRGYGYGCKCAIDLLVQNVPEVDAFIFFAADGANDPRDIMALVAAHQQGSDLVIGTRTLSSENRRVMGWPHMLANRMLGWWCGLLTGRFYSDLGPLRVIDRQLFDAIGMREWTFGWTIESQIRAALMGARIREIPVRERTRVAGEQKVSRVSWLHTLSVGLEILGAGVRVRLGNQLCKRQAAIARTSEDPAIQCESLAGDPRS